MSQNDAGRAPRKARGKRPPRKDSGNRIVFRVTAEERQRLVSEAGEVGISTYVRARLFGGGVRNRDALRKIAALHVAGQVLVNRPIGRELIMRASSDLLAEIINPLGLAFRELCHGCP